MKTIQEILKSRGLTKENYDTQGGSPFYVENIERAMEIYAEQFKVKNLNISDVRGQLIAFLREQIKLKYITIYENDFEFADKILKAINLP
jgi:hypothetical protein